MFGYPGPAEPFLRKFLLTKYFFIIFGLTRGVAQPGRASALGAECHQFESGYPDMKVAPHRGAIFIFV